ncbi:MAG: haloacid dehalogenase type II [Solirubrobacteraceae bacterium]|jgi:2-haloacid dehalogenase
MALRWTLFDLNGTLLDPGGIADPLGGGADERRLVDAAFHEALLLTMADTLSGAPYRPLPDYLRATLERGLRAAGRDTKDLDAAMERASAMDPFSTAAGALDRLEDAGLAVGLLTNSAAASAEQSLEAAGLRDRFQAVIATDAVEVFKPHPRVYGYAVERLEARPEEICLVAAHGWDVMGAMRAGLRGAWVAHSERWLVPTLPDPDVRGEDLEDAAAKIVCELA